MANNIIDGDYYDDGYDDDKNKKNSNNNNHRTRQLCSKKVAFVKPYFSRSTARVTISLIMSVCPSVFSRLKTRV